jgi:hypothetical protein
MVESQGVGVPVEPQSAQAETRPEDNGTQRLQSHLPETETQWRSALGRWRVAEALGLPGRSTALAERA